MRLGTGPYKPEGDWTGYFIRGDHALYVWSNDLTWAAELLQKQDTFESMVCAREMRGYATKLRTCEEPPSQTSCAYEHIAGWETA